MKTLGLISLCAAAIFMLSLSMASGYDSSGFNITVEGDNINITHNSDELLGGAGYNLTFTTEDKMDAFIMPGITMVKVPIRWDVTTLLVPIPSDIPRGESYYATLWITASLGGELRTFPVARTWIHK